MIERIRDLEDRNKLGAVLVSLFVISVLILVTSQTFDKPSPQIATGLSSSILTFMLVTLYWQQAGIMSNQEELMEREHDCLIVAYLGGTRAYPQLYLENIGPSAAYDVEATCDFGPETVQIRSPLIPDGEKVSEDLPSVRSSNEFTGIPKSSELLDAIEDGRVKEDIEIDVHYYNSIHERTYSNWSRNLRESLESIRSGEHRTPEDMKEEIHGTLQSLEQTIDDIGWRTE